MQNLLAVEAKMTQPAPAVTVLSKPPRTHPEKSNFQWTPKDLRMIFRSNFEKRNTCMNRPSERKKKNALKSKPIDRDGLKQLKLFDMKVFESPRIHVERVDTVSGPPGATCLDSSSNNGRQRDLEKATILNK